MNLDTDQELKIEEAAAAADEKMRRSLLGGNPPLAAFHLGRLTALEEILGKEKGRCTESTRFLASSG